VDRPKDKSAALEPSRAALPVRAIGAAEVTAYLRQHPEFLLDHGELLDALMPPAQRRGETVVDMQHFLLERQRAEITRLKGQHKSLLATTRANLASQNRVHSAVVALLAASSFEQLIQIVTTDLAVLLDADAVTIAVERSGPARPRLSHHGVLILDGGTVDGVLGLERDALLLAETAGDPKLFGDGAGLVRSAALLRLNVSPAAPAGLLCIGARQAGKFHAGQGVELLCFLARTLGITIAAWLDLPG